MANNPITTLAEDAAQINAARAKRLQILDGLTTASTLADPAGVQTEELFKALADGRDVSDPDFYTFSILEYMYKYMPFGKYGRWLVPVILGYGLLCALEKAVELISSAFSALQGNSLVQQAEAVFGFGPLASANAAATPGVKKDHFGRIAFDKGAIESVFDPKMMASGLVAVLPPYASTLVVNAYKSAGNGEATAALQSECAKAKADAQKLANALAQMGVDPNKVLAGMALPSQAPIQTTYVRPTYTQPVYAQPVQQMSPLEQAGYQLLPSVVTGLGNWIGSWGESNSGSSWEDDRVVRDRVVRDMNAATDLGLRTTSKRTNY